MQLTHIIRETRYLDRMTFTIPEFALNVTLQEDRYLQCVDGLTDMLERYYKVTPSPGSVSVLVTCVPCHQVHALKDIKQHSSLSTQDLAAPATYSCMSNT